jgi:uncharacterized protein YlzI (FlbEa/FlbD family)
MIWLTDSVNGHKVAVNPEHIVAVFQVPEPKDPSTPEAIHQHVGKTAINLITGSIIVDETEYDVVGRIMAK